MTLLPLLAFLALLAQTAHAGDSKPKPPPPKSGWAGLDGGVGLAGLGAGTSAVEGEPANGFGGVGPWASLAATWRLSGDWGLSARLAGGAAFGPTPDVTPPAVEPGTSWAEPLATRAGAGFLAMEARWLGDRTTLGLGPAYGLGGARVSGEVDGVENVPMAARLRGPGLLVEGSLEVYKHKAFTLGPGLQIVVTTDGGRWSTWGALSLACAWDAQYPPESR